MTPHAPESSSEKSGDGEVGGQPFFATSRHVEAIGQLFAAKRLRTIFAMVENRDYTAARDRIQMNMLRRRSLVGARRKQVES
jgi:hypothetical protein